MGRASTPLKVLSNGDLRAFTATEERYLAYLAGTHLGAITTSDVSSLNTSAGNSVGTHTNTVFTGSIGDTGNPLTYNQSSTTIYQRTGTPNEASRKPIIAWDYSRNGIKEMNNTELDVLVERLLKIINENEYPGSFRLASSSPGSDWNVHISNVFTDTRTDGTTTNYNLYIRTTGYTSNGPSNSDLPATLNRSGGSGGAYQGFKRGNQSDIKLTLGQRAKSKILSSGIGTYQLRSSNQGAPTDPGTWVSRGSALDTRQLTEEQDYSQDYSGNYLGEFTVFQTYEGNYEGNFTTFVDYTSTRIGLYEGNYEGNFETSLEFQKDYVQFIETTDYIEKNFEGNYEGNYLGFIRTSADYETNFEGNFEGNFVGNYIGAVNYETNYTSLSILDYTGSSSVTFEGFTRTSADFTSYSEEAFQGDFTTTFAGFVETTADIAKERSVTYEGNYISEFVVPTSIEFINNYLNDYIGDYISNYEAVYLGNYVDFTPGETSFSGNYVLAEYEGWEFAYRDSVISFEGNYEGANYQSTSIRDYLSLKDYTHNYEGNFEGNYTGDFLNYANPLILDGGASTDYIGYEGGSKAEFISHTAVYRYPTSGYEGIPMTAYSDGTGNGDSSVVINQGGTTPRTISIGNVPRNRTVQFVGKAGNYTLSVYVAGSYKFPAQIAADYGDINPYQDTFTWAYTGTNAVVVPINDPNVVNDTGVQNFFTTSVSSGGVGWTTTQWNARKAYIRRITQINPVFFDSFSYIRNFGYKYSATLANVNIRQDWYAPSSGTSVVLLRTWGRRGSDNALIEAPTLTITSYAVNTAETYAATYTADYTGFSHVDLSYEGTYEQIVNYERNFESTRVTNYEGNFLGFESYVGNYLGDFIGDFVSIGTYTAQYAGGYESIRQSVFHPTYTGKTDYTSTRIVTDYYSGPTNNYEGTATYGDNYEGNYVNDYIGYVGTYLNEFINANLAYEVGYIGNYIKAYEGNFEANYSSLRDYVNYANPYTDYSLGAYQGNYIADYTSLRDYSSLRDIKYEGNYLGDFLRDYTTYQDFESTRITSYEGTYQADYIADYTSLSDYSSTRVSTVVKGFEANYSSLATYTADYVTVADYTSTRVTDYGQDYVGNFLATLDYTSVSTEDYITTIGYEGGYQQNYAGEYAADTILASAGTIETYTLYVRIA